MTPWWPWAFPGEPERIMDLLRRYPNGWLQMPADATIMPRFSFFRLGRRV